MTDMNHVIDFRSAANARAPESPAIYASIRTQFDVIFDDYGPDLGKLVIAHFAANIAETIGADDYSSVEYDAIAYRYTVFKENVRMNHAIAADPHVVTDFCARANLRPITHDRIFTYTNKRSNKDIVTNFRGWRNNGGGMYLRLALLRRIQNLRRQHKSKFGILYFDATAIVKWRSTRDD